MLQRLLILISLMLLAIPAAQAASFDCAKAQTPFEQAICDDPALSHTDEVLAVAYATAVGGLSDEATEIMRKAQRSWLDYLAGVCVDAVLPGNEDPGVERTACLQQAYDQRIRGLENSRMSGGLRFYLHDRFLALPDDSGDSWVKVGTKETSFPYIDGTDAEATSFNAVMTAATEGYAAFYDPEAIVNSELNNASETMDNDARITIVAVNDRRISLELNDYWYGHGAAHGNYTISYMHFLRGDNRGLKASDIFTGDAWKKKLADLAFAGLQASLGVDGLFIETADDITEAVADPSRWNFTEAGLMIRFQPYEVTAYAAGAVSTVIPWSELDADLAEDAYPIAVY